ncbi:OmpA family protein [Streptomyces sp. NPDC050738]|uniref:OmpA family protein n=1 Tax=Streptomyces sp. NPDC050738 TaxID=3154744 RepID=UPI003437A6D3
MNIDLQDTLDDGPLGDWDPDTYPARTRTRPLRTRIALVLLLAGTLLAGGLLWAGRGSTPPRGDVLAVVEKTSRTPGELPGRLRERAAELAGSGGSMELYVVGAEARRVGDLDLDVRRQGAPEHDPALRAAAVKARLDDLEAAAAAALVGRSGASLHAALRTIDEETATVQGRREVVLATSVLDTTENPLNMAQLIRLTPAAAVDRLMRTSVGHLDLSHADLQVILLPLSGPGQPPLTPAGDVWRESFITALTGRLGARLRTPVRSTSDRQPWPGASVVPVVRTPGEPTPDPGRPVRFDTALFRPDEAVLIDPEALRPAVRGIAARFAAVSRQSSGAHITLDGYCARWGDNPAGARSLSLRRAEVLAALLADAGVDRGALHARGYGFDRRADTSRGPQDAAQRTVIVTITP